MSVRDLNYAFLSMRIRNHPHLEVQQSLVLSSPSMYIHMLYSGWQTKLEQGTGWVHATCFENAEVTNTVTPNTKSIDVESQPAVTVASLTPE